DYYCQVFDSSANVFF
nr:immunoglobulin light chain junction region [Macaca mulatta]MOX78916.1 immunoglobulin light chain junction region [Macaca mulatta]MOX80609.1 immunoglobulin light chain junction region [Macaca mulatta]MOX81265.1 immunoglobulin light chain junction region [Macaca mulatta]MOX82581.1 immunoglobulin light chain junction region [Macaca mulatta]